MNLFLANCRLKTICVFISRLFGIRAPVALYRSIGRSWESPGRVRPVITSPLWIRSDSFHVGSREGLDCQRLVNMSPGRGPSPPDVTAFIFSVWIQGPTLFADGGNKCLWPHCTVREMWSFEWECLQEAFPPNNLVANKHDKPGLLWSTGHSKAKPEHSLLSLLQGFWLFLYPSFYKNEWENSDWSSKLSEEVAYQVSQCASDQNFLFLLAYPASDTVRLSGGGKGWIAKLNSCGHFFHFQAMGHSVCIIMSQTFCFSFYII